MPKRAETWLGYDLQKVIKDSQDGHDLSMNSLFSKRHLKAEI